MRIKITCYLDAESDVVDPTHPTGLTEQGYLSVVNMLHGFEDIETEMADDDE